MDTLIHKKTIIQKKSIDLIRSKPSILSIAYSCSLYFLVISTLSAQQIPDSTFLPEISAPKYILKDGPTVYIDEGHNNFHKKDGRYKSFASLLERDGYRVASSRGNFNKSTFTPGSILVISNALNEQNIQDWSLPNPSAFDRNEIEFIRDWVNQGGSLFLIADHMPFPGAAHDLASVFGFEFSNGFAFNTSKKANSVGDRLIEFSRKKGTLMENEITNGKSNQEQVDRVVTFTGQAFQIPLEAKSILKFPKGIEVLLPQTAWEFEGAKNIPVEGWSQGAYRSFGKGRVVVFGEAAMFSAQLKGPDKIKMGMNAVYADQNYQLLLNIIHWLDQSLSN